MSTQHYFLRSHYQNSIIRGLDDSLSSQQGTAIHRDIFPLSSTESNNLLSNRNLQGWPDPDALPFSEMSPTDKSTNVDDNEKVQVVDGPGVLLMLGCFFLFL